MKETMNCLKERISTIWKATATIVKNKDYTTRELVLAVITIFLSGILFGIIISPKKSTMFGSNNGNNNVGVSDLHKEEKIEEKKKK